MSRLRSSKGSGLVLSILTLTIATIAATSAVVSLRSLKRESLYQHRVLQAMALAETGLNDAFASLQSAPSWRTGFAQKSFAGGYYSVQLTNDARPTLTSTGYAKPLHLLGRAYRTIRVRVETLPIARMDYALFANDNVVLASGAVVDSYDSESDPDPLAFGASAGVRGNFELWFSSSALVRGNAEFRTSSFPPSSSVTGAVTRLGGDPAPIPSTSGAAHSSDSNNDNLAGLTPSSAYDAQTKNVSVPLGSTATLATGVYYFNQLSVQGTLTLDVTNGPVVVYVASTTAITGALVNPTKRPGNLWIYGQATAPQPFTLNSSQSFHGVLQGTWLEVSVRSHLYGAVHAKACSLTSSGRLHQDLSLKRPALSVVRMMPGTLETLAKRL